MVLTQLFWELRLIWWWIWSRIAVASAVVASLVVLMVVILIEWLSILPLFVVVALCFGVVSWASIFSYVDITGAIENLL